MKKGSGGSKKATWIMVWALILITVLGIVAGIISGPSTRSSASNVNATTAPAITSADWSEGNKNAKVSVIEYGDFQCPACGAYYPIVKKLAADYGDRVLFVFRNFPLYQIHQDAGLAAQAAEAAGIEGKYWAMHGLLYEKQTEWSLLPLGIGVQNYFDGLASSLGLDIHKLHEDMNSDRVKNKIQGDVDGANTAQVNHTPTFFVNLKQIANPANYDEFKAVLDRALASSQ